MRILLALLLGCLSSQAATYYVNSGTGNDSRTTTQAQSAGTPWLTLKASIAKLSAGDTLIAAGTFYETYSTFTVSGASGNPISINGTGATITPYGGGNSSGNYHFTGNYVNLSGFTVKGQPSGLSWILWFDGNNCTVNGCTFTNLTGYAGGGSGDTMVAVSLAGNNNTVTNCSFKSTADIDLFRVWGHGNVITHCLATNCSNPGYYSRTIHADLIQTYYWGSGAISYSNVLECSVFQNCGCSGGWISDWDGGSGYYPGSIHDWTYRNNIFANDGLGLNGGPAGQSVQVDSVMHFYGNIFYNWSQAVAWFTTPCNGSTFDNNVMINSGFNNNVPAMAAVKSNAWDLASVHITGSALNAMTNYFLPLMPLVISDPGFVNAAGGDFHLTAGSVLIGKGVNLSGDLSASLVDMDGNARPASGAWDIGPYVFNGQPWRATVAPPQRLRVVGF